MSKLTIKNKRALIPLFIGGSLIVAATVVLLVFFDDNKTSSSEDLKEPNYGAIDVDNTSKEEYEIDRTEFDVTDMFSIDETAKLENIEGYTGKRYGENSTLLRFEFGGVSFDIDAITGSDLQVGQYENSAIIKYTDDYQLKLYKINDYATSKLTTGNVFGDYTNLVIEYDALKQEYDNECKAKTEFEELDEYNGNDDGGILSYTPIYDFLYDNDLIYEIPLYTKLQVKEALSCAFNVPDDYVYNNSNAITTNYAFGTTGSYKEYIEEGDTEHTEYYLIYCDSGVFAAELFYSENVFDSGYITSSNMYSLVAPLHSEWDRLILIDSEEYNSDEYKDVNYEKLDSIDGLVEVVEFTEDDLINEEKYTSSDAQEDLTESSLEEAEG